MKTASLSKYALLATTLALCLAGCNESTDNSAPLSTPAAPNAIASPRAAQVVTQYAIVTLNKDEAFTYNAKLEANSDLGMETSVACRQNALSGKKVSKVRGRGVVNRITLEQGSTLIVQRDMTLTERDGSFAEGAPYVAITCLGQAQRAAAQTDATTEVVALEPGIPTNDYPIISARWNEGSFSTVVCRASATEQIDEVVQAGAVLNRITLLKGSRALIQRNLNYKTPDGSTLRENGYQQYALLDCAL